MATKSETDLIDQARAGQAQAFRALVEAHQARAYVTAFRLMGQAELAEEMVQNAFVQAFRSLDGFRGDAAFGTWLHRILTRCCLGHLRSRAYRQRLSQVEAQDADLCVKNQAITTLAQADARVQVAKVLAQLPPKERLVLQLFYLDEYPVKEIQAQTGWSQSNIKVLLHRARKRFRKLMPVAPEALLALYAEG
jgi:RNA polymerase sigma-70 factor (ECF subfamily)